MTRFHPFATALHLHERTAPASWAAYLVSGDGSGLDPCDRRAARAWIALEGLGQPVDCQPAGFVAWHDARRLAPSAAECETYFFLASPEADQ